MTNLGEQIDSMVKRAVATGNTEALDRMREAITATSDAMPSLLERFELVWEYEVSMAAIRKLAVMIRESGDHDLEADFAVLVSSTRYRWEAATRGAKAKIQNKENVRRRWQRQRNESRYATEIRRAKLMTAAQKDRDEILDVLVGPASSKTSEARAKLARVLLKAGALEPVRRKRTK
jgi:hypothetical protein